MLINHNLEVKTYLLTAGHRLEENKTHELAEFHLSGGCLLDHLSPPTARKLKYVEELKIYFPSLLRSVSLPH